jgi:polar amino acid transport system substrate-binding protein
MLHAYGRAALGAALTIAASLAILGLGLRPALAGAFEDAQARGRLLVGVRADYPPYAFIDSEGRNAGFEIDIAKFLALRLMGSENRLKLVPVTGSRRIKALGEKRVDMVIASLATTDDRKAQILFSEPYYASGVGLLARKDAPLRAWADLRRRRVCAIEGAGYDEQLVQFGADMLRFPAAPAAFKALREGQCEGLAYDDSALAARLTEADWSAEYRLALAPIQVVPWAIGLRRDDEASRTLVNPIVVEMEQTGFIVALEAKWRLPPSAYARDRMERLRRAPVQNR